MVPLRGVHLPERDPGRRESRREPDGSVEQPDLGGRSHRHQPFHVVLEDRQGAVIDVEAASLRKSRRQELTRQALDHAEEVGQPARRDGRRPHPPAVEPDGDAPSP